MSDALDLDQDFGTSQVRYLYKGAGRKIAGKELATGRPHHLAVSYVCDEDRKFHDIGHFTSGRRQELPEFAENSLCLFVLVLAFDGLQVASACGEARKIRDVPHHQTVRPKPRSSFCHSRADYSANRRQEIPFTIRCSLDA